MKKISLILLTMLSLSIATSCTDETASMDEPNSNEVNITDNGLNSAMTEAMNIASEPGKSAFIVYNSAEGEYMVFSEEDFEIASAFADMVVATPQHETYKKPAGNGWILAGYGKTKLDAMKYARTLAGKIGANQDFEIHVEHLSDGRWALYYRIIEKQREYA